MEDFSISLLNSDTKPDVSGFFDNLSSHVFAPYILQPIRLTKSYKKLIENVFINTIELFLTQIMEHLRYWIAFSNL